MFLNMMDCLKFNRLEIYKFMAFDYCSFKTSYIFLNSMQIKTSFLFTLSLNSSCIFFIMVRFKIQCFCFDSYSWVSQFDKVISKKHPVLGNFLSFLVKVNYNFISNLLRYRSIDCFQITCFKFHVWNFLKIFRFFAKQFVYFNKTIFILFFHNL